MYLALLAPHRVLTPFLAILLVASALTFAGCDKSMVYNPSVANLNKKAQELMAQGDAAGAVSRLESARDLNPNEPLTLYNLGIAYATNGQTGKAIVTFEELLAQKKYPSGLSESQVLQSLSISYEALADQLMEKAVQLEEKKPQEDAASLKAQAIEALEKSKLIYDNWLKAPALTASAKDQMTVHQHELEKRIDEIQHPEKHPTAVQ